MPMSPFTTETDGSEETSFLMTTYFVAALHKRKCSSFMRTRSGVNSNDKAG